MVRKGSLHVRQIAIAHLWVTRALPSGGSAYPKIDALGTQDERDLYISLSLKYHLVTILEVSREPETPHALFSPNWES